MFNQSHLVLLPMVLEFSKFGPRMEVDSFSWILNCSINVLRPYLVPKNIYFIHVYTFSYNF